MSLSINALKKSHVKTLHADLNKGRSAITLLCGDQGEKLTLFRYYVLIRNADEPRGERLGEPFGLLLFYIKKIHRVSGLLQCLIASLSRLFSLSLDHDVLNCRNSAHDDQMRITRWAENGCFQRG